MFRWVFALLVFFTFFQGCGSSTYRRSSIQIGIDACWYPIDFGQQTPYINGFIEDLLLEIAQRSGVEFNRISANWDSLYDGLMQGQYEVVISSLPPYDFNLAQYDMSKNILDTGPVLIVPMQASYSHLGGINGGQIGILAGDFPSLALLQSLNLIIRTYPSIPELLSAVASKTVEGALLNRIQAVAYVDDLFSTNLKIIGKPLDATGLHFITLKGKSNWLMNELNQKLEAIKKTKQFQSLLKKWRLGNCTQTT